MEFNGMKKKIIAAILSLIILQPGFAFAKTIKKEGSNMTRADICKKNYETLFNSQWNPNTGSDPEMMEILQKYIFGEVFTVGNLDIKTREMITVTSLAVQQTLPQLNAHINAALNAGASPLELRETIYLCAPFIGFPKTLNALGVLNEVFGSRNIATPLAKAGTVNENERFIKGSEIQTPLYGDEIAREMQGLPDNLGSEAARFLTEFCFGDIYTRGVLDTKTRELLAVCILTTTGNTETLKSHISGAIKAGNQPETLAAAIIQCMPYTGFPNALSALKVLKNETGKNTVTVDFKQPFKLGEINPYSKYFTGTTYLNRLCAKDDIWNSSIANVTFEKGARTNWHKHTGGQILLVTAGEGRYQERGKEIQILKPGDVVKIAPNVEHWHGAAPESTFAHISIEPNLPNNQSIWLEPVSDREYKK